MMDPFVASDIFLTSTWDVAAVVQSIRNFWHCASTGKVRRMMTNVSTVADSSVAIRQLGVTLTQRFGGGILIVSQGEQNLG